MSLFRWYEEDEDDLFLRHHHQHQLRSLLDVDSSGAAAAAAAAPHELNDDEVGKQDSNLKFVAPATFPGNYLPDDWRHEQQQRGGAARVVLRGRVEVRSPATSR